MRMELPVVTVDNLLNACPAWKNVCGVEPPTTKKALASPALVIPQTEALRLSRSHKTRSGPSVGVFTLVSDRIA